MSKPEVACYMFDFTLGSKDQDYEDSKTNYYLFEKNDIRSKLKGYCKDGKFSLELGTESNYVHYQGRISLIKKMRLSELKKTFKDDESLKGIHFSVTSNAVHKDDDMSYVTKDVTRLIGPWSLKDKDDEQFISKEIRELKELYSWQKKIIELSKIHDSRHINLIIDPIIGNKGKSFLVEYMRCYGLACSIPYANDYDTLMRRVYCMETNTCYLFDIPRAINKDRLNQLYAALETIKGGEAHDDRYSFKAKYFEKPNIFVFTNTIPDFNCLSPDRWILWHIDDSLELAQYEIILPQKTKEEINPYHIVCDNGIELKSKSKFQNKSTEPTMISKSNTKTKKKPIEYPNTLF